MVILRLTVCVICSLSELHILKKTRKAGKEAVLSFRLFKTDPRFQVHFFSKVNVAEERFSTHKGTHNLNQNHNRGWEVHEKVLICKITRTSQVQ